MMNITFMIGCFKPTVLLLQCIGIQIKNKSYPSHKIIDYKTYGVCSREKVLL